jgi:hypothetical protein
MSIDTKETSVKANRLWWPWKVFLLLVLIDLVGMLIGVVLPAVNAGGIRVTIQNRGSRRLGSVMVHVTGESYGLGDIAAGGTGEAAVRVAGESHLEIEFVDADGKPKRLNAGGHFEPGCRGTIQVSIKDGVIDENEQRVNKR